MELAKKLILSQQFTIGDISTICGYTEPCHFSREFRRNVGVSPTEFLKASQK
jgi:AraC-like DNA-binding protein